MRQSVVFEIHECATAQIGDERNFVSSGNGGEVGLGDGFAESLNLVVAGVHLHQERRLRSDGRLEVLGCGSDSWYPLRPTCSPLSP